MTGKREDSLEAASAAEPPAGRLHDGSHWVMWLISVLFFSQTALFGYYYYRTTAVKHASTRGLEHSLGEFDFVDRHAHANEISRAQFTLHATLADETGDYGSRLLAARKQKVRQQIESLLRQLSGGYFASPSLSQLKEKMRTTIDDAAGEQIVEEVILTDLSLSWAGSSVDSSAQDRAPMEMDLLGAPNRQRRPSATDVFVQR